MREVKSKVLVLVLAIALSMLFTAIPVMAEPTKGQKVPATFTVIPPPDSTPGELRYTPSGVAHGKGLVEVYPAILTIDGTPHDVTFVSVTQVANWNPQQETMIMHCNEIFYISSQGSPDGFAGTATKKFYGFSWVTHMWSSQRIYNVMHGFGSFEGQTLMLSYEGPISATNTGYCLKG